MSLQIVNLSCSEDIIHHLKKLFMHFIPVVFLFGRHTYLHICVHISKPLLVTTGMISDVI